MRRFINPLQLWFARSNHSDLVRQLEFLKVENQILRAKLGRKVYVSPRERSRLLRYGQLVGPAIRDLLSIVTLGTWQRWLRGGYRPRGGRPGRVGRPRTPDEIQQLVLRIGRETGWGYSRIRGELWKLGITSVSRSNIQNIMRRHGIETGPQRGPGTWNDFVKRHARTLWACDFLCKQMLTWRGWKEAYLLVFINVQSRRVWTSPSTFHPTKRWSADQATEFCRRHAGEVNQPQLLIRDRDAKFWGLFDEALHSQGVLPVKLPFCAPNLNVYAERLIQTLELECLDHFVPFRLKHLDHILAEFIQYYHRDRPHQSLGNVPLTEFRRAPARASPCESGTVICHERLGGLLKSYGWRAAA